MSGHYADDLNGVEFSDLADSARQTFADLFDLRALRTKPSNATTGSGAHHPKRLFVTDHRHIRHGPKEDTLLAAQKLAGRLSFLYLWLRRPSGHQAYLRLLARPTRSGALCWSTNLPRHFAIYQSPVHTIPAGPPVAILYADAFFQAGEIRHKAGHVPARVRSQHRNRKTNGRPTCRVQGRPHPGTP